MGRESKERGENEGEKEWVSGTVLRKGFFSFHVKTEQM